MLRKKIIKFYSVIRKNGVITTEYERNVVHADDEKIFLLINSTILIFAHLPVCVHDCKMSSSAFSNQFIPLLKVNWKNFTYVLRFVLETPLKMFKWGLSKECRFSQLLT